MDIVDSAINFVGSAIGSANAAALQALGSIAKTNTFDNNPKAYANCGSWQKGSTDFVAISGHDVVLGTWGNSEDTATIPVPAHLSQPIKKFFSKSNQKAFLVKSLTFRSGKSEASKQATQLTEPAELYVVVPDCHITLFRGWSLDGFHKPRLLKSGKPSTNVWWSKYPKYRESLEQDLFDFLEHAKQENAKVIQIGDLLDVWHVQWMYERAFDIYHNCATTSSEEYIFNGYGKKRTPSARQQWVNMHRRFPVELLSRPKDWPYLDKNGAPTTRYCWWKFLPEYLGCTEQSVRTAWLTKVAPIDVIAIIFWGMDIDKYATPLGPKALTYLKEVLSVRQVDTSDLIDVFFKTVPQWHNDFVPDSNLDFWKSVAVLKHSIAPGPANTANAYMAPVNHLAKQDEPLHFLDLEKVEDRIRQNYPMLNAHLKKFADTLGTRFLRGNHDCEEKNEYLLSKFTDPKAPTEAELRKEFSVKGKAPLDDNDVKLESATTICCGYEGRVCIEHGDAWDYQNNGRNFFRFGVGTPWSGDHKADAVDSALNAITGTLIGKDGGYHMPKGSYNDTQLEDPGDTLLTFKSFAGDFGLDPPANARAQAIFLSTNDKAKKVRLIVMGHTHIPKLEGNVRKYLERYSSIVRELLE